MHSSDFQKLQIIHLHPWGHIQKCSHYANLNSPQRLYLLVPWILWLSFISSTSNMKKAATAFKKKSMSSFPAAYMWSGRIIKIAILPHLFKNHNRSYIGQNNRSLGILTKSKMDSLCDAHMAEIQNDGLNLLVVLKV